MMICAHDQARDSLNLYNQLIKEAKNGKIQECPKPCKFVMIDFSRSAHYPAKNSSGGKLEIKFRKFIKYSKVSYTYQGLEFFAEFGGYLGLLLGMSLNQVPYLIASLVNHIKTVLKEY